MDVAAQQGFFFTDFKNSYIPQILKEIYIDSVYTPFLNGKKKHVIVDVGGNIGLTSYYFSEYADQVITVEPSKQHIANLTKMVKFNKIDNITVYPCALGDEDKEVTFYHSVNNTMFSLSNVVANNSVTEKVQMSTLSTLMEKNKIEHIDFMKLDMEGFEGNFIASADFTKNAEKISCILGEWHTWSNMNQQLFKNTLQDLGFEFKWLNKTEASLFVAERI